MKTDPIAQRARSLLQAEALASGDFSEINFNEPRWNPWRIAEHAMVKFAAALTTEGRPEGLEREAVATAVREACDYAASLRLGTRSAIVERATSTILALATQHRQTDAPASGEVDTMIMVRVHTLLSTLEAGDFANADVGRAYAEEAAELTTLLSGSTPTPSEGARDSALEEAAKVAEGFGSNAYSEGLSEDVVMARSYAAHDIAAAIRALRTAKPEQEDHVVGFADTDVEQPEQAGAGFVMVPVEPTEAMLEAAAGYSPSLRADARVQWDLMVRAGLPDMPTHDPELTDCDGPAGGGQSAMIAAAPQEQNSGEGE